MVASAVTLQGFTREFLSELFEYRPRLGVLVRRQARNGRNAWKGRVVGNVDGKGYLHVSILGKFVRVHRLCFFLYHGWVPPQLDHRDTDRLNNRIVNLRPASQKQNAGNTRMHKHNTSGFRGVSKSTRSGLWHAQIKIDGKQTYLGRFEDPVMAARCYDNAAQVHFGKFARLNRA